MSSKIELAKDWAETRHHGLNAQINFVTEALDVPSNGRAFNSGNFLKSDAMLSEIGVPDRVRFLAGVAKFNTVRMGAPHEPMIIDVKPLAKINGRIEIVPG